MPKLVLVGLDDQETVLEKQPHQTVVMEVIRDSGNDAVLALCGGCCSCGTCHVHVDQAWLDKLPPMSSDEDDLLSISPHRTPCSRLSCQLKFVDELDGLRVSAIPQL